MNKRISELREQSVNTAPYVSHERAVLMTEFYKSSAAKSVSPPVERALAFKYLMENRTICINKGELIVGERGPAPKATYTYPELTTHSMTDLNILDSRDRIPFKVSEETREVYRTKIIPYWKGRTVREKIFSEMSAEWKNAYNAGIYTEFMEQRATGQTL